MMKQHGNVQSEALYFMCLCINPSSHLHNYVMVKSNVMVPAELTVVYCLNAPAEMIRRPAEQMNNGDLITSWNIYIYAHIYIIQ